VTPGGAIQELDLLAYADGLLEPARREEVEALLRRDPEAAGRVAAYVAQNQAIRAAYGGVVAEPVPARLLAVLDRPPQASFWRRPLRFAAFAASLAAAGFLGWMANAPQGGGTQPSQALVEASLALHADWSPRPEAAAVGSAEGPLLLPKALASEPEGELALRIPPPDLTPLGLQLLALRTTEGRGLPGVQLVYGDGKGERLSLFVTSAAGGGAVVPRVTYRSGADADLAFWRDGPIAFALIGEGAAGSAERVAAQVRGALQGAPLLLPPATGGGLAAGNGPSAEPRGSLDDAPLLRPTPAAGNGGSESM